MASRYEWIGGHMARQGWFSYFLSRIPKENLREELWLRPCIQDLVSERLGCGHTVCAGCTADLKHGHFLIRCPLCRSETALPHLCNNHADSSPDVNEEMNNMKNCIECSSVIHMEKLRHCLTCATSIHDNESTLNHLCADCCLDHHHDHSVKRYTEIYKAVEEQCAKTVQKGMANAAKFHRIAASLHAKSDRIRASLKSFDDSIDVLDKKISENSKWLQALLKNEDVASNQSKLQSLAAEEAHIFEAASITSARVQIVLEQCERSISNISARDLELSKKDEHPPIHASAEEIRCGRFLVKRASTVPKRRQTLPFLEQLS